MTNVPVQPVLAAPLFPRIYAAHLDLLRRLTSEQWDLPTVCAGWSVKDVALHMLADDVGWLSGGRDGFHERPDRPIDNWDSLVGWIDMRNDLWVRAARRMSARLLSELAAVVGDLLIEYVITLDPFAPGPVINWAGDEPAPMWMQVGRELTERWMHHQHISDAVGITSLKEPDVVHAVLDMFVRALPHAYRSVIVPDGSVLTLALSGDGGGKWHLLRKSGRWRLYSVVDAPSTCMLTLPVDAAWRLFTKGISSDLARLQARIEGDVQLAEPVLHMVSIIA